MNIDKYYNVPKTVGELKKILETYDDDVALEYYDERVGGGFAVRVEYDPDMGDLPDYKDNPRILMFGNAGPRFEG
jgi:hypothetical protein